MARYIDEWQWMDESMGHHINLEITESGNLEMEVFEPPFENVIDGEYKLIKDSQRAELILSISDLEEIILDLLEALAQMKLKKHLINTNPA